MATLYTDLTVSLEEVHNRSNGRLAGGQIRMARGTFTLTAATATADVINVVSLPVGAVVLPHLSYLVHEAMGTALTISVGDSTDTDRYMASTVLVTGTSAGVRPFILVDWDSATVGGDVSAFPVSAIATPHVITEATRMVTATLILVTTPTAGNDIQFNIAYHAQV
jgi:hypothetical protein